MIQTADQDSVYQTAPKYKLYSVKAVVIAAIIGTPLAGGYFMAANYQRLGNKSYAQRTLLFSLLVVVASFILGQLLPENTPALVVSLPIVIALAQTMKRLQGPALEQHQHNQGQLESCWKAQEFHFCLCSRY